MIYQPLTNFVRSATRVTIYLDGSGGITEQDARAGLHIIGRKLASAKTDCTLLIFGESDLIEVGTFRPETVVEKFDTMAIPLPHGPTFFEPVLAHWAVKKVPGERAIVLSDGVFDLQGKVPSDMYLVEIGE
jgi:hypothetical protein